MRGCDSPFGRASRFVHSLTNFLLALSFCAMATTPRSVARHLRSLVRGDVEFDAVSRRLYATDAGLTQIEPLGVVSPRDAEDVVRLVSLRRGDRAVVGTQRHGLGP